MQRCEPLIEKAKSENGHLIAKTAIFSILVVGGLTWWVNSKQNEKMLQNIREIIREEIAADRAVNPENGGNHNHDNDDNQDQNDNRTTANL